MADKKELNQEELDGVSGGFLFKTGGEVGLGKLGGGKKALAAGIDIGSEGVMRCPGCGKSITTPASDYNCSCGAVYHAATKQWDNPKLIGGGNIGSGTALG